MTTPNTKVAFHFNPFAGVKPEDIHDILVPKFDIADLVEKIEHEDTLIVEFAGKKGRGKTTHLLYLHRHLPSCPIFLLNRGTDYKQIIDHHSDTVLIDSIHHLTLLQRQKVFRKKKTIILTTHFTKKAEYALCGKPVHRIKFRGLTLKTLRDIVNKRLMLVSPDHSAKMLLNDELLKALLKKHKDDYRAIINELFDRFQQL